MTTTCRRRIAVLGIMLESNGRAPVTTEQDFRDSVYLEGDALLDFLGAGEYDAFVPRLGELLAFEPVPILFCSGDAGGPCSNAFFDNALTTLRRRLAAALPLDGVYIIAHGAGLTESFDDLDGIYFEAVRQTVGPRVPIVATSDLHGNVSAGMFGSVDALIAYQTNPHVDMADRSRDAADVMARLLAGEPLYSAWVRVPMITSQLSQLTGPGHPLGSIMQTCRASRQESTAVAFTSVWPGFSFCDQPDMGMTIVVGAWGQPRLAEALVRRIAASAWYLRRRFSAELIPVARMCELAILANSGAFAAPLMFADVADNPGGGALGNTVWLLQALLQAGATNGQLGVVHDPALVAQAARAGEGQRFLARFNAERATLESGSLSADATVMRVVDARFVGTLGTARGWPVNLGLSALLDVSGIKVVVSSVRQQIMGADYLRHFGLEPAKADFLVVKSRGHFRAGFADISPNDCIFHVDAPGLTAPDVTKYPRNRVSRPVFPLDPDMRWSAEAAAISVRGAASND